MVGVTFGGYSESIVVDEHFGLRVPPSLNSAGAAPFFCAGITTYPPLRHWGVGKEEMLDFCGAHNITADVEVIPIQKVQRSL